MASPMALFSSCSQLHQNDIIKQILKVDSLPEGHHVTDGILGYFWSIDTRYYTANICLCSTDERTIGDAEFAENVQAFIVHFDTKDEESWAQVKRWSPFLKEIEPDIQLLVCDTCKQGDAVSREEAWKWCLENAFELIELQPDTSENSDEEDDFQETVGIDRIIQALHAHSWPNLVMKEKPSYRSSLMTQMMRDEAKNKRELKQQTDTEGSSKITIHTGITIPDDNKLDTVEKNTKGEQPPSVSEFKNPLSSQNKESHGAWGKAEATVEQAFENNFKDTHSTCKPKGIDFTGITAKGDIEEKYMLASQLEQTCDKTCTTEDLTAIGQSPAGSAQMKTQSEDSVEGGLIGDEDLQMLAALGDSDHLDTDSFEKLFDKLRVMKEQAEALPLERRKQYAEKVAIEFWRAIGGEDEEIDGLTSDEDNIT